MSLFTSPEEHAANGPETWVVVKSVRHWRLETADGGVLETFPTKKAAEAGRVEGRIADLYDRESRWYAGEEIPSWKPWTQILAERERHEAWLASKAAP